MKIPRPQQRLPHGGRVLYELCRMDREPEVVCLFREGEVSRERARLPDTLVWQADFDPMLYFWPIATAQCVVAFFLLTSRPDDGGLKRLERALRRDEARHIELVWRTAAPAEWQEEPWGAPSFQYEILRKWVEDVADAQAISD